MNHRLEHKKISANNNDDFHTVQDLQKRGRVIIIITQTTLNQTIQGLVVQSPIKLIVRVRVKF